MQMPPVILSSNPLHPSLVLQPIASTHWDPGNDVDHTRLPHAIGQPQAQNWYLRGKEETLAGSPGSDERVYPMLYVSHHRWDSSLIPSIRVGVHPIDMSTMLCLSFRLNLPSSEVDGTWPYQRYALCHLDA